LALEILWWEKAESYMLLNHLSSINSTRNLHTSYRKRMHHIFIWQLQYPTVTVCGIFLPLIPGL
jgi:hypothetical protein